MRSRTRPIPNFENEAEERRFWESHDSTDYVEWSRAERVRLPNLKPSTTSISLRLPVSLLKRIKLAAHKRDVPYQSLIKTWHAERSRRTEAWEMLRRIAGRPIWQAALPKRAEVGPGHNHRSCSLALRAGAAHD